MVESGFVSIFGNEDDGKESEILTNGKRDSI